MGKHAVKKRDSKCNFFFNVRTLYYPELFDIILIIRNINRNLGPIIPGLLTCSKSLISALQSMSVPTDSSHLSSVRNVGTPTAQRIRPFNIDFYGIWVTKALNGDRELFLVFGSGYNLSQENPLIGRKTPQNPGEIPDLPPGRPQKLIRLPQAARTKTSFYYRKHAPAYAK